MTTAVLVLLLVSVPARAGIRPGEPEVVSLGSGGERLGAVGGLEGWGMSADGSRVVFTTTEGVFVRDRRSHLTSTVAVPVGSSASLQVVGMSQDGARVVFAVLGEGRWSLYLWNTRSAAPVLLTPDVPLALDDPLPELRLPSSYHYFPGGWEYAFSSMGDLETVEVRRQAVAQPGGVPNTALAFTGIGEVYRFAVSTGARTMAADFSWYSSPNLPPGLVVYRGTPFLGTRSRDGRWSVYFSTEAETPDDLDPPARRDGPPRGDLFLHDFTAGTTRLISGALAARGDERSVVSDDGRRVLFEGRTWVVGEGDQLEWTPDGPVLWDSGTVARLTGLPEEVGVRSGDATLDRLGLIIEDDAYAYEISSGNLVPLGSLTTSAVWISADGSTALVGSTGPSGGVVDLFAFPIEPLPFDDISGSNFVDDIVWLAGQGITRGCNPGGTLFCPGDPVTRGQMAAFLNRALALPAPAEGDPFVDDAGIFEVDIEALAAAGITRGCSVDGTRFCPGDPVTRGQMAAFLNRALAAR